MKKKLTAIAVFIVPCFAWVVICAALGFNLPIAFLGGQFVGALSMNAALYLLLKG